MMADYRCPLVKVVTSLAQMAVGRMNIQQQVAVHDPFFAMPDELLLHIFAYLTPDDLVKSVPLVSKRWATLSRDKTLSIRLRIDLSKMDVQEALRLIQMTTKLRSLTVVGYNYKSWFKCDDILDSVSKLDKLTLWGVKVEKISTLSRLVQRCGHLGDVQISRCWLPNYLPPLLDILAPCGHLEFLSLNNGKSKRPPLLNFTIERRWTRLQWVYLWPRNHPADSELDLLASTSSGHLRSLSICLQHPGSFLLLGQFQQLEFLDLYHRRITDDGLLEGLGQLTNLRLLTLQGPCSLTSPAIQAFFSRPQIQLKTLRLDRIFNMDDSCLEAISRCASLRDVVLIRCNQITLSGLIQLRKKVRVRTSLCLQVKLSETIRRNILQFFTRYGVVMLIDLLDAFGIEVIPGLFAFPAATIFMLSLLYVFSCQ